MEGGKKKDFITLSVWKLTVLAGYQSADLVEYQ